jgi:hypothetical protein
MTMMVKLCYALGRRLAMEEELQKTSGLLDPQPILESPLTRRVLPALGLGALIGAPAGILLGRGTVAPEDVKGALGGLLPPTATQVDLERTWRGGWGALYGLLGGAALGATAPEWGPLLTRRAKTIGRSLL